MPEPTSVLAPIGVHRAVIAASDLVEHRRGRYIRLALSLKGEAEGITVYIFLTPSIAWKYKRDLERLGVDLQIYFEWDGVDLAEFMAQSLANTLTGTHAWVRIDHEERDGRIINKAELEE